MNLFERANADLGAILSDITGGSQPVTVTNPQGQSLEVNGIFGDIGLQTNPEAGSPIMGRFVHVSIRLADIVTLGVPVGQADPSETPWVIEYTDLAATARKCRVVETLPDRTIGLIVCILERYQ